MSQVFFFTFQVERRPDVPIPVCMVMKLRDVYTGTAFNFKRLMLLCYQLICRGAKNWTYLSLKQLLSPSSHTYRMVGKAIKLLFR